MLQCPFLMLLALSVMGGIMSKNAEIHSRPNLETLLDSLNALMVFFSERHDKLNLDALFGIRVVQGELNRALLKAKSREYLIVRDNTEIRNKISEILHIAERTVDQALSEVEKKNPEYFGNFEPIVRKPWRMFELEPQKLKKTEENELLSENDNPVMQGQPNTLTEEESDRCMGTLLGNGGSEKCDVNTCWDLMSRNGTRLYFTTHQILWFQLGISAGCQQQFNQKAEKVGGIEKIFQRLCHNIIFQMDALFKDGSVPIHHQDLFLEKGVVCGGMGFMDAVNLTWLEGVMKWQHKKHRCFREMDLDISDEDGTLEFNELVAAKKKEWRSRNLLDDADMGNYCSAHKSGVAAGFYAVYTRLFLDPEYIKHQLWPDLYGEDYSPVEGNMTRYLAIGFAGASFLLFTICKKRSPRFLSAFDLLRKCKSTNM